MLLKNLLKTLKKKKIKKNHLRKSQKLKRKRKKNQLKHLRKNLKQKSQRKKNQKLKI